MPAFNARLLERCLALGDKDHYRKGGRETDLSARGPQSTAGAAGDTLRRGHVETHEGRQVRDRHRRGQAPVRGRPRACGARAGRRAARVRGSGCSMPPGPASRRIRAPTATTPPAASGPSLQIGLPWRQARGLAQQPGPGGASRPAARMARRAGARGPRRGVAHAQAGRTRERMGERGGGDGRDPPGPPAASTAPAYAWPRPDTPPGPSPSPTTSPSTRRGYDLAFAGREDNA